MRAQPHQVVEDARIPSNIVRMYCARSGALDTEQFLDRTHIAVLATSSIHSPGDPCSRSTGYRLCSASFGAAMQQADVRVGALDHFAVHLQHQAQHAMCSRVLRAEFGERF